LVLSWKFLARQSENPENLDIGEVRAVISCRSRLSNGRKRKKTLGKSECADERSNRMIDPIDWMEEGFACCYAVEGKVKAVVSCVSELSTW